MDEVTLMDQRIEAEHGLIGSAYIAQADVRTECGWLKPEAFWLERAGKWWARFLAGEDGTEIAIDEGMLQDVFDWSNALPTSLYALKYAHKVAECTFLQDVEQLYLDAARAAHFGEFDKVSGIQEKIAAMQPHAKRGARDMLDGAGAFIEDIEADVRALPTGIKQLDEAIGGLERKTESVIAARPSQGKSTLALQIAMHAAKHKVRVLFVSIEMSEVNLLARVFCPLVGVTWLDVKRGLVKPADIERLKNAASEMAAAHAPYFFIHDKPATTETVWELAQTHHADLVIVDHLRLLGDMPDLPEVKRLGWITRRMKAMAKALNLHVCLLVQLNRGADADANHAPELKHLRDSGEIEEDADIVMVLHGIPVKEKDRYLPTRDTDIWVRKSRDGVRDGQVELRYNLRTQTFAGRRKDGQPD